MNCQRTILRLRRAACLLLIGLVYRMGACPCGCVEHNYWLQTLGLASDHDHGVPMDLALVAQDHDCAGESPELYCDTATRSGSDLSWLTYGLSSAHPDVMVTVRDDEVPTGRGPPGRVASHSVRDTTQVFLL